jgi:hypothetical protein
VSLCAKNRRIFDHKLTLGAFEKADTAMLEQLLCHDAALEMVGSRTWFAGRVTCLPYLAGGVLGQPGDWRIAAIAANGQPAAAAYHRDEDGALRAFGIAVLEVTATGSPASSCSANPVSSGYSACRWCRDLSHPCVEIAHTVVDRRLDSSGGCNECGRV